MAKYLYNNQPWSLLCCGNSLRCVVFFHLQIWRHGEFLCLYISLHYFKRIEFFMVQGLWMGIICGLGTQVIALVTMILRTYWDEGVVDVSW